MSHRPIFRLIAVHGTRTANCLVALLFAVSLLAGQGATPVRADLGVLRRVAPVGISAGDCGSTWATACDLQYALSLSVPTDVLWVKEGTYMPGTARTDSFVLKSGVFLYGGFGGYETVLETRDPKTHISILSGEIGGAALTDNSYHVVSASGVDVGALLDGFTITGGNADGPTSTDQSGGGLYLTAGNPTLRNLIFTGNRAYHFGGGLYAESASSPSLRNITFSANTALDTGGGMYMTAGDPSLTNVNFDHNVAVVNAGGLYLFDSDAVLTQGTFDHNTAVKGGGMQILGTSAPQLTDVTFSANSATDGGGIYNAATGVLSLSGATFNGNTAGHALVAGSGGGLYNDASSPTLANVTFQGNSASTLGSGGGMMNHLGSNPTLKNATFSGNRAGVHGGAVSNDSINTLVIEDSIFWDDSADAEIYAYFTNLTLTDSIVQGGCPTHMGGTCTNVITTDPALFPLANYGGLTKTMALRSDSVAVNAGGYNSVCESKDQRGVTRPTGKDCDIGAYEFGYHVISGNVGVPRGRLGYYDGGAKEAQADSSGNYAFMVPLDFSGDVIPKKTGYSFSPDHITYSLVHSHFTNQDYTATSLWNSWAGGVQVLSDAPVVAVARPHVGEEVTAYDGSASGSLTAYVPMLFKNAFGGSYMSAFYVQNVTTGGPAHISIDYYATSGAHTCGPIADTIEVRASHGYWLPGQACLPDGWAGSAVVTSSDFPILAVARPHIGAEVASYDGVAAGGLTSYLPMLFKTAWGSYDSAFYVQNLDPDNAAHVTVDYYDTDGDLTCSKPADTIPPLSSHGIWVPSETCLPLGWVGGAVVTSSDYPIATIGRPHVGVQVMTYNGFSGGELESYLPMLFKNAWGSYDSAFYVQNVDPDLDAHVTVKYYDTNGNLTCTKPEDTIHPLSSHGTWLPSESCLPVGWVGAAAISADTSIVAIGRPHVGAQVTTYDGFTGGGTTMNLPMLFKQMWGTYNSAYYIQNVSESGPALVRLYYYDGSGRLTCEWQDSIPSLSTFGYWLPSAHCLP